MVRHGRRRLFLVLWIILSSFWDEFLVSKRREWKINGHLCVWGSPHVQAPADSHFGRTTSPCHRWWFDVCDFVFFFFQFFRFCLRLEPNSINLQTKQSSAEFQSDRKFDFTPEKKYYSEFEARTTARKTYRNWINFKRRFATSSRQRVLDFWLLSNYDADDLFIFGF